MFTGNCLSSDKFPAEKITDYLRPFYFRKYEVTNAEYGAFVNWVKDSIARTRLAYFLPNGKLDREKKYNLYDRRTDSIVNLRLPIEKRHFNRNQTDVTKLNYRFTLRPDGFPADTVNVYPDTLAWTDDFTFSFNDPMANMYFWHPAYGNYPVAGITYWQCIAFLEWKTNQLQAMLNKKGIHCRVKCNLPSELEWDYASTAELNDDGQTTLVSRHYTGTCDYSWLTDLRLLRYTGNDEKVFVFEKKPDETQQSVLSPGRRKQGHFIVFADDFDKPLRRMDLDDEKTWGDFIYDGFFHTGPAQLNSDGVPLAKTKHKATINERTKAHYDGATGICWMDGNVSEWMREDVSQWRGFFAKHRLVVNGPYEEERRLLLDYETYYFDQLPAHGKLVRGSNWYDERFAMKYGKNVGGLQSKTFCNPDSAHCTLGFRYVIYLEEK